MRGSVAEQSMVRRLLGGVCALAVVSAGAACRSQPTSERVPIQPEPAVQQTASATPPLAATGAPGVAVRAPPSASAAPGPAAADGPAPEAAGFSIECAGPGGERMGTHGCLIRGRVHAVRQVDLSPQAPRMPGASPRQREPLRALEVQIDPDDAIPCRPRAGPGAAEPRLPGAADPHERSGTILVLGAARIAGALGVGESLCGFTHVVQEAGLGYPSGWEGELTDGEGRLLGASSLAFDRAASILLARTWAFSREGAVRRHAIDEGGAFVYHRSVRIHHGGASALSTEGAEVVLRARDGSFAVWATSDLTEGPVPVFVGHHDGFAFSAVRVPAE